MLGVNDVFFVIRDIALKLSLKRNSSSEYLIVHFLMVCIIDIILSPLCLWTLELRVTKAQSKTLPTLQFFCRERRYYLPS